MVKFVTPMAVYIQEYSWLPEKLEKSASGLSLTVASEHASDFWIEFYASNKHTRDTWASSCPTI